MDQKPSPTILIEDTDITAMFNTKKIAALTSSSMENDINNKSTIR